MRNLPHHAFEHNQTWLETSLIAQDLLCWTKLICLTGELATAEPKRLRHRLLHIAAQARASRATHPPQTRSRLAVVRSARRRVQRSCARSRRSAEHPTAPAASDLTTDHAAPTKSACPKTTAVGANAPALTDQTAISRPTNPAHPVNHSRATQTELTITTLTALRG